jgi:hypothetical protein
VTDATKRMVGVRLSQESRDQLAALQKHYGLSQSALVEYLLREEHARMVAERPPMRRTRLAAVEMSTVVDKPRTISTDVDEDDIEEMEAQRFARSHASIRQAEFDRR